MDNDAFWQLVCWAKGSPRLYEAVCDFMHFVRVTPWYEMQQVLDGYFGFRREVGVLWIEYARMKALRACEREAELLYGWAVAATINPMGWPGLFWASANIDLCESEAV